MLFGNDYVQETILNKAKEIASEKGFQIVYGAVMGSISRGIASYDSDCDLRFLYVREDFPQKIYWPKEHSEKELIYRYFTRDDHSTEVSISVPFDRIAFWELSSFLTYLVEPVIGDETWNANGLYYIVEHTFLSPYTWDPYGLQQLIIPYLNILHKEKYEKNYMKTIIANIHTDKTNVVMKDYLDAIWASLSIWWIDTYHMVSPVSIYSLLAAYPNAMFRQKIDNLINQTYEKCRQYYLENGNTIRGIARDNVLMERDEEIEQFIETSFNSIDRKQEFSVDEQYALMVQICQAVKRHLYPKEIAEMNESEKK